MKKQRLLFDTECTDCKQKSTCEWVNTPQCCRSITDKLRIELGNNRKSREIVAKIIITTEYDYNNHTVEKNVDKQGMFVLQKPYIFGKPFLRSEIQGKGDCGTFSTQYYKWNT